MSFVRLTELAEMGHSNMFRCDSEREKWKISYQLEAVVFGCVILLISKAIWEKRVYGSWWKKGRLIKQKWEDHYSAWSLQKQVVNACATFRASWQGVTGKNGMCNIFIQSITFTVQYKNGF